jgi:hypothetical protein
VLWRSHTPNQSFGPGYLRGAGCPRWGRQTGRERRTPARVSTCTVTTTASAAGPGPQPEEVQEGQPQGKQIRLRGQTCRRRGAVAHPPPPLKAQLRPG